MEWYEYLFLLIVLGCVITTLVYMGYVAANNDKKTEIFSQVTTLGLVNLLLVVALGLMMTYYLEAYPQGFQSYTIFMIHLSLFVSVLAVTITTIH